MLRNIIVVFVSVVAGLIIILMGSSYLLVSDISGDNPSLAVRLLVLLAVFIGFLIPGFIVWFSIKKRKLALIAMFILFAVLSGWPGLWLVLFLKYSGLARLLGFSGVPQ